MIPNGIFTITNQAGDHRTFSVRTQPKDSKFMPGQRVVALLSGADNENDYTCFGKIVPDCVEGCHERVQLWRKREESKLFKYYAFLLMRIQNALETENPEQHAEEENLDFKLPVLGRVYRVQFSKRCRICNRRLTTPESIRLGIGPICAGGGRDGE